MRLTYYFHVTSEDRGDAELLLQEQRSARLGNTHPCWRPLIRLCCRTAWYGERAEHTARTRTRITPRTTAFIFRPTRSPAPLLLLLPLLPLFSLLLLLLLLLLLPPPVSGRSLIY